MSQVWCGLHTPGIGSLPSPQTAQWSLRRLPQVQSDVTGLLLSSGPEPVISSQVRSGRAGVFGVNRVELLNHCVRSSQFALPGFLCYPLPPPPPPPTSQTPICIRRRPVDDIDFRDPRSSSRPRRRAASVYVVSHARHHPLPKFTGGTNPSSRLNVHTHRGVPPRLPALRLTRALISPITGSPPALHPFHETTTPND